MPLSRKAKWWIVLGALPFILVLAGALALKLLFTSERLKSMVIPRLEASTGRTVTIEEISLKIFPSIALVIDGLSISNLREEGFSPDPFLALESLDINVKLLPLLRSRLEVTSFDLKRPRLLLEVNNANRTNYSNLTTGGMPPDASDLQAQRTPEEEASGLAILATNLRVHDGSVDYVDHKEDAAIRVRQFALAMEVSGDGNTLLLSGNAGTDSLSYGSVEVPLLAGLHLRLDHRIVYDGLLDQLRFEKGVVTVQSIPLALAGTVDRVRKDPVLDLTLGSDSLNIADLFSLVPAEYRKNMEGVKGEGIAHVRIAISGTVSDSTSADLSGTVTARGASIHYPGLPKPVTDIAVVSSFLRTADRQEFRVDTLTASLGGAPLRMAMTVRNFDDPHVSLSAGGALNLSTVPEYYPLEQGTELGGVVTLDARVLGKVSTPDALKSDGSVRFQDVSIKTATTPSPVRKLNGTVTFTNDVAQSRGISMVIGGSDLTMAWSVKNYLSLLSRDAARPRATGTMTLQSTRLSTTDIMSREEQPASTGHGAAGGRSASASREKGPFLLPDIDLDVNASIQRLSTEKFEFSDVRGNLRLSKGLVTMQNLRLNAFGGSVVSSGSLNLARPERPEFDLALNLNALEAGALLTPFTSFGQRLNGAFTMNTRLKGALNDTLGLVPEALQGAGKVSVKNGALTGVKVNQALASALSLPDLEIIHFKDWGNDFAVEGGRLVLRDLTINALNAQYVINGSQGLDGSLAYRMTLYLPESVSGRLKVSGFAGEALNLFKDASGRYKFDFAVGGTMDSPKLQMDTEAVQKRAEELAKQRLNDEKKKLEQQLKEKAGDALKKLFKKQSPGAR